VCESQELPLLDQLSQVQVLAVASDPEFYERCQDCFNTLLEGGSEFLIAFAADLTRLAAVTTSLFSLPLATTRPKRRIWVLLGTEMG
jgi:hypothetical protein